MNRPVDFSDRPIYLPAVQARANRGLMCTKQAEGILK